MGLSQIDRERLAIGRWATYLPYKSPTATNVYPPGKKLSKRMFHKLLQNGAIDSDASDNLFVDLYKRGICHYDQLGMISGQRGLHVVPPLWLDYDVEQPLTPDSTCQYLRSEDYLKDLACLPLFMGILSILAYHDTGSPLTLHTKSFRENLSGELKSGVTKIATRYTRFMGINGKQSNVLTDIYRWDLGWKADQNEFSIISTEIPDELLNIKGMLLGRDTIYRKCWGLAYETLETNYIRPYVPTSQGLIYLVSSAGEQISLVAEYDGTSFSSTQATPHEFFQDVEPNDCFLVVSSEQ